MTTPTPGLMLPTQQAMLAGNPRDSAIAAQAAQTAKLTSLSKSVSGGRGNRRGRSRRMCRCNCHCRSCRRCVHKRSGGRRRTRAHRRRRRGGASAAAPATVVVPQFTMQYAATGGPGQTPNDIIKQNAQVSTQGAANSVYDNYAMQKGGYVYDDGAMVGEVREGKRRRKSRRKHRDRDRDVPPTGAEM